jgi:PBP1b-binding outer membrane lipoprotein LpoB
MNKLILVLALVMFGCSTATAPTRTVLDCSELTTDPDITPKKSHKGCTYKQVPVAPTATPLQAPAELVK